MAREVKGNALSVGNGITCFMRISKDYIDQTIENKDIKDNGITIDMGTVSDVMYSTQRDITPNYVAGNRNPIGANKGKRFSSGRIVFGTFDQDTLNFIINSVVVKYGQNETSNNGILNYLQKGSYFVNEIQEKTMNVTTSNSSAANINNETPITFLDELPPVDLIFTGVADSIAKIFETGNQPTGKRNVKYKMELKGIKFLNDSFGISAGSPLSDQVVDIMILGGVKQWVEFK